MDGQSQYKVDRAPRGGWFVLRRNEPTEASWSTWTVVSKHDTRSEAVEACKVGNPNSED